MQKYIKIISRWWWLVLSGFLIVTVAGFAFSSMQAPRYRTTVTLIVSPKSSMTELTSVPQNLDTLGNDSIINTYAEILRSRNIYEKAIEGLNLSELSAGTADILVEVIQRTNMIKLQAEGTDPKILYAMANAIAGHAIQYVDQLYELFEIKVLDAAVVPGEPYSPDIMRNTFLAAVLGLIVGISAAFFAEYIRRPLEILETFSIIDSETGLHTRRYFTQRLKEEINRAKRHGRTLAVCMINLKSIDKADNLYPEQTRLTVRRRALAFTKRHIRQDEILARWDDSILAWLLYETSETSTRQAIERLNGLLEGKVFEDDETGMVFSYTAVFAAAIYHGDDTDGELISLAEQALRQTLKRGEDAVTIFNGSQAEMSETPAKTREAIAK